MKHNQPWALAALVAVGLGFAGSEAGAAVMPLDGSWIKLIEAAPTDGEGEQTPFTYSGGPWSFFSADPVRFCATDWLWAGDRFEVYDLGRLVATSSDIPLTSVYASGPDEALLDKAFSKVCLLFDPGIHSVTIRSVAVAPSWTDATVAFKAERVITVPDGGSCAVLLGLALAGLAGARKGLGGKGGPAARLAPC